MTQQDSESDVQATRMEVNVYSAEDRSGPGAVPDVDFEELERVEELVIDHDFRLAEDSYDVTLLTMAFPTTEENIEAVESIAETLEEWYQEEQVEYEAVPNANNTTSDIFPVTQMITVEQDRTNEGKMVDSGESDSASRECPECGGELTEVEDTEETYCGDCGLCVNGGEDDGPEWRASFDDRDGDEKYRVGNPSGDWDEGDPGTVERADRDWGIDTSGPEGEVIVGIVSEPYRTEHEYYRIEDVEEFFGDDWGDSDAMANRIHEAGLEPFREVSLPDADWVIPRH